MYATWLQTARHHRYVWSPSKHNKQKDKCPSRRRFLQLQTVTTVLSVSPHKDKMFHSTNHNRVLSMKNCDFVYDLSKCPGCFSLYLRRFIMRNIFANNFPFVFSNRKAVFHSCRLPVFLFIDSWASTICLMYRSLDFITVVEIFLFYINCVFYVERFEYCFVFYSCMDTQVYY